MPQMLFPFFPDGVTHVNPELAFAKRDGRVTYFNGQSAVVSHDVEDIQSFRLYVAQFHALGVAKQSELAEAFGVTKKLILRSVKIYREKGPAGFFEQRRTRGPAVLTSSVLAEAQSLLDDGNETAAVAKQLDLKPNTLAKAVRDGRLHKPQPQKSGPVAEASSKSQRSLEDSEAPMGRGASNTTARVAASLGQLSSVPSEFQAALDVPRGGVLLALPALLAMGLLKRAKDHFQLPKGYYGLVNIFLLLAFMALARLKTIEALRYHAPGEWGKLLGLDRAPEVRTLRGKIAQLVQEEGQVEQWSAELCADWMKAQPEQATAFYVDGHVRVYHGNQTKLPRRYVARQKLCLRACTDYWVNAMDGQPFFVVYQDVDPGLIQVLERDIVPRLERDAPNQPTEEEMEENPLLHRFTLVFDRAGYSPKLFKRLKERRIACLTYRKNPGEKWEEYEFFPTKVTLVSGDTVEMQLAERGVLLGSKKNEQIWVREIRRLMPCGHQTAVVSTDYVSDAGPAAATMFARWCQENFFKYMRENYGIDRLMTHETQDIPGSTSVVNPEYRRLDREVRRLNGTLSRKKAELGALELSTLTANDELEETADVEAQLHRKAELYEETVLLDHTIDKFKQQRKAAGRHIALSELPEDQRFRGLSGGTKELLDTVKMLAYRAETAMAQIVREANPHVRNPRIMLRGLYETEADLLPDYENKILYVRLHNQANLRGDGVLSRLCKELNETETVFPGTDLRLIYQLVSNEDPQKDAAKAPDL